ncbi:MULTISPECIES: hypothetical protein [Haloarcula]|uniref:hypothetical protein n=1 Tax=Haloarcula TaxID=2237 RepID=UPI0023EA89FA|nr:hypothetical protein [Halomicroarcula sp. XH51]
MAKALFYPFHKLWHKHDETCPECSPLPMGEIELFPNEVVIRMKPRAEDLFKNCYKNDSNDE